MNELPPSIYLIFFALIGLVVGSFLNVVVHRLPHMMSRQWRRECAELSASSLHQGPGDENEHVPEETYNLVVPRSACPHCGHPIKAIENIPVLSYLWQRGRCTACHAPISPRYLIVEVFGAMICVIAALRFGLSWQSVAVAVLGLGLLTAAAIDLETQLLPDTITLPLLWLGLLLNLNDLFVPLHDAVLGAVCGYLSLWVIYHLFKLLTGKEGMGYGDFKLLALLGAWFGWQMLPLTILLSSLAGSIAGLSLMILRRHRREIPIPFGPYLALAGWIALVWGHTITESYLRFARIH